MYRLAFLSFALMSLPVKAGAMIWFQPLDRQETVAEAVFVGLCLVDWAQTLDIARHPDRYREAGCMLGHHPSVQRVNTWFPIGILAHPIITWAIPKSWRPLWQYPWIGIELQCTYGNRKAGISISLHH